jgi:hypothetical protein
MKVSDEEDDLEDEEIAENPQIPKIPEATPVVFTRLTNLPRVENDMEILEVIANLPEEILKQFILLSHPDLEKLRALCIFRQENPSVVLTIMVRLYVYLAQNKMNFNIFRRAHNFFIDLDNEVGAEPVKQFFTMYNDLASALHSVEVNRAEAIKWERAVEFLKQEADRVAGETERIGQELEQKEQQDAQITGRLRLLMQTFDLKQLNKNTDLLDMGNKLAQGVTVLQQQLTMLQQEIAEKQKIATDLQNSIGMLHQERGALERQMRTFKEQWNMRT